LDLQQREAKKLGLGMRARSNAIAPVSVVADKAGGELRHKVEKERFDPSRLPLPCRGVFPFARTSAWLGRRLANLSICSRVARQTLTLQMCIPLGKQCGSRGAGKLGWHTMAYCTAMASNPPTTVLNEVGACLYAVMGQRGSLNLGSYRVLLIQWLLARNHWTRGPSMMRQFT